MTPAQQQPEHDLSQTLARQAERFADAGGSPLDLEQVLSRAGEIRRGRRMRATMVMAAVVLAVAVPVGITSLVNNEHNKPGPSPAATPTPDTIDTTPDKSPIRLGDYRQGAAPSQGYAFDNKLYGEGEPRPYGDGKGSETSSVAHINGGFLVAQYGSNGDGLTASFVADEGDGTDLTWPMESGFVVSRARNVGVFIDADGTVMAVQDGGTLSFEVGQLPAAVGYQPEAVVGENCSGRPEIDECTVYVEVNFENGPSQQIWAVSPNVAPKPVFAGLLNVAGISKNGFVAGMVSFSDEGSCWEVRDAAGKQLWKTCDNSLLEFSPDGKYILADAPYHDGPGGGQLTIRDAQTGHVVLNLTNVPDAFVSGLVWEDSTHVLAPVYDKGNWAVERIALDGSREYATAKAPDDDSYTSPFKLG